MPPTEEALKQAAAKGPSDIQRDDVQFAGTARVFPGAPALLDALNVVLEDLFGGFGQLF